MSGYSWRLANSGPSLPKPQSLLIRQSNILFICKSHHYPCLAKKKVSPESGIIVIIMIKGRLYIDNEYHPREQQCLNISWDRLSRLWRRQRRIPFSNLEISNIDELITLVLSFTQAGWGHWLNGIHGLLLFYYFLF